MIGTVQLSGRTEIWTSAGVLEFVPPATLKIFGGGGGGGGGGEANGAVEVAGLAEEELIDFYSSPAWSCVVGLGASDVVLARPSSGSVRVIGKLDRLDFGGSYDPGGMHRLAFHPLDEHDLVIEYEFGLARIDSRTERIVWQYVHGDVTQRVSTLADGRLLLEGEHEQLLISVDDGRPSFAR